MTTQQFALSTLKSIEATAQTRDAFKYGRVKRLAKSLIAMGYAFLLHDLSPVAAQTLAVANPVQKEVVRASNKPKIVLRGITGQYYTMKSGIRREVFVSPTGRKFVFTASGKKYYPKSLNRG